MNYSTKSHSTLPVLDEIIDKVKNSSLRLDELLFVCVQHLLYTTVDLMKALIELDAEPKNIHIMGKIYSSCPGVVKQIKSMGLHCHDSTMPSCLGGFEACFLKDVRYMWSAVLEKLQTTQVKGIIVLDDGGKCIATIPNEVLKKYPVFSIEQTASGAAYIKFTRPPLPVIEVASSAAKQQLESYMIAEAVCQKLGEILSLCNKSTTCGVAGLGVIGQAVVSKLLSMGYEVIVYDKVRKKNYFEGAKTAYNIDQLVSSSDYIFGCTGKDITVNMDLSSIQKSKTFISCSSQDIEFKSILELVQRDLYYASVNVLDDIEYKLNNASVKIIRGGYPVNLDNSGESVPARDIQLTRGLLLGGVIQAISCLAEDVPLGHTQYMLDPKVQQLVVATWQNAGENSIAKQLLSRLNNFVDEKWVKKNSGGIYSYNAFIGKILS